MARRTLRLGAACLTAALPGLLCAGPALAATPAGARVQIQGAAPLSDGDAVTGALPSSAAVSLTLALAPRDPDALAAYAAAVSDPGSPEHGDYLSVAQFAARFGATDQAVAAVRAAVAQSGLQVGDLSPDGLSLSASGTAAQAEDAFDTDLSHVATDDGTTAYTDTTAPTLPASVAPLVQSVAGLDTLPQQAPVGLDAAPGTQPRTAGSTGPSDCTAADAGGANTPQRIASAYGLDGLWSAGDVGAGTTVALYELEPYAASDVAAYQGCFGTSATVTNVTVDGGATCGTDTDCGAEDALDIEDLAGLAPSAALAVYEGPNTGAGAYDTYAAIVEADTAQVVSTSWGLCEARQTTSAARAENTLFQEAAAQGQAVFAAAGDSGADDCAGSSQAGRAAVDDPASQPYVTGVGGTSLASYLSPATETVWNDGAFAGGAGGGGVSARWAQPSWQSSQAMIQSSTTCGTRVTVCREVPDVSADSDPETGYAVYYGGRWTEYGGTSAAAPTWAALVTLADSSSYCTGRSTRVGFANPTLYGLTSSDFYDVTSGTNSYDGVTGYPAAGGYDMAAGLGAPDGSLLVPALCGAAAGTTVPEPPATSTSTSNPPASTTTTTPVAGDPSSPGTTVAAAPVTTPVTATTTTPTTTSGASTHDPGVAAISFVAPHARSARVGARVAQPLRAEDRFGRRLSYTAHGLPRGLRIQRASGMVTGEPRRPGTFTSTVVATDTAGDAQSVVVRWRVAPRVRDTTRRRLRKDA